MSEMDARDFTEVDMREYGEFRYLQGWSRRDRKCRENHSVLRPCTHGMPSCRVASDCFLQRVN